MLKSIVPVLVAVVLTFTIATIFQHSAYLQVLVSQGNNSCRTFRETGKTVCGAFLAYWQKNGGLPIFGYPISNEFVEKSKL